MKRRLLVLLAAVLVGALACTGVAPDPEEPADDFSLDTKDVGVEAEGGTVQVNVGGTRVFHLKSWPQWVEEPSVQGRTIVVVVPKNDSGEERSGDVTISDEEGSSLSFRISQKTSTKIPVLADWDSPFPHHSLFYRFTATWCGYCPMMATSVKNAQDQMPGKMLLLNIHGSDSELEFANYRKLAQQYKVSGYPTGIVDGRRKINNNEIEYTTAAIVDAVEETEEFYPVSSRIAFNSSFRVSDSQLSIDLYLFIRYAADYKVTVVLEQDGLIASQSNYTGPSWTAYEHNDVAVLSLTDILGDPFTVTEDKTVEHMQYSVQLPVKYKIEDLKVLVAVQRAFGDQKVRASGHFGGYYVDNCAVGKAGMDLPL